MSGCRDRHNIRISNLPSILAILAFFPIIVNSATCRKTSSCSCTYADGSYIDLSPLDAGGTFPHFHDVPDSQELDLFSWNPCSSFSEGDCNASAACQIRPMIPIPEYYTIGTQDSATFQEQNGTLVLIYFAEQGLVLRTLKINLTCDPDEDGVLHVEGEKAKTIYFMELRSKYACPRGTPTEPPPLSCIKTSECSCSFEDGRVVDLSPLDTNGVGVARFQDVMDMKFTSWYSWNPCSGFSEGNCEDVAVCQIGPIVPNPSNYFNLGTQNSAEFTTVNGTLILQYAKSTDVIKVTKILLTCDNNTEGELLAYGLEENNGVEEYHLELRSVYSCPREKPGPIQACIQTSLCSCQFGNGTSVDLSPLDSKSSTPRFKDILSSDRQGWFSWNPCSPFTEGDCRSVAVCDIGPIVPDPKYLGLGYQDSASFQTAFDGGLSLNYHDPNSTRSVSIKLICDEDKYGNLTILEHGDTTPHFTFQLRSKYACSSSLTKPSWERHSSSGHSDALKEDTTTVITNENISENPETAELSFTKSVLSQTP